MTYKACILFIAKCLTLDQHPQRKHEIRRAITSGAVNWGDVVKASSGQLVMPALYLQLKRNGLLAELPEDLIEYFEEITDLNRERNLAILKQAQDITEAMHEIGIAPIFLKGVAHLLAGLYIDVAERMIGDIDFLVPKDRMEEAANLLTAKGYEPMCAYEPEVSPDQKHYPRLQNFNCPAAVEIHKEILRPGTQYLLQGCELENGKQPVGEWQNRAFVPSVKNMLLHNALNIQLNDKAYAFNFISLRQMYDFLLLSAKEDSYGIVEEYGKRFNVFNTYMATISFVFSNPETIRYKRTFRSSYFVNKTAFFLNHSSLFQVYKTLKYILRNVRQFFIYLIKSILSKQTRKHMWIRLSNPQWLLEHFRSYVVFYKRN